MQRLDGERGGVAFARGETVERACELLTRDARGLFGGDAFKHLCKRGAAGERGRAAVGEEARGGDPAAAYTQREPKPVAAGGIGQFGAGVCVCEFAAVARVREMIFESLGVGHRSLKSQVSGPKSQVNQAFRLET